MSIHPEEMEFAKPVIDQIEAEAERDPPPVFDGGMEQVRDALIGEAASMEASCPTLLEVLDQMTRPRATHPVICPPGMEMTFGERAAFRMGQDSILVWLRHLMNEAKEPPHE